MRLEKNNVEDLYPPMKKSVKRRLTVNLTYIAHGSGCPDVSVCAVTPLLILLCAASLYFPVFTAYPAAFSDLAA